jgi:hypothetical protein
MSAWGWRARSIANWTIVALVVVAGAALFVFSQYYLSGRRISEAASTQRLKVGDCLQERYTGAGLPTVVKKSRCDGPHFGEVYAILTVPDTQDYPGDEALRRFGANCGRELSAYSPSPDLQFDVITGYPKSDAWADGARSIVCVAQANGERWAPIRG